MLVKFDRCHKYISIFVSFAKPSSTAKVNKTEGFESPNTLSSMLSPELPDNQAATDDFLFSFKLDTTVCTELPAGAILRCEVNSAQPPGFGNVGR